MTAGYSNRSVQEKLGLRTSMKYAILHPPEGYEKTLGMPFQESNLPVTGDQMDFIQYFVTDFIELEKAFTILKKTLNKKGMLWIAWPKKSQGLETNLSEDEVRRVGIRHHMVDIKVCAIDEVWSGLKFVYRVKDR
jgi:hypothetical protein